MPTFPLGGHAAQPPISLVVGQAAWWVPVLARNSKRQKLTFAEALRDFLQNVSFHCYGKLVEPGRRLQERFFWIVFHIAALSILIVFLWRNQINCERALETTIFDPLYPIHKVAFPAVSICTINRISNTSAVQYAEELNSRDPRKRGVDYFYQKIHLLRFNYNYPEEVVDYGRPLEFQQFLDLFDSDDTFMYNTRRRMNMLTPRCSDILLQCRLGGRHINCSEEFVETLTTRGFCCTFNSNGTYSAPRSHNMGLHGPPWGLIVLLNASNKDYFYKTSRLDGFVTSIYTANSYPDSASGGVLTHYVPTGISTFLSMTPKILETVDEARSMKPRVRNCYFANEMPRIFGKDYSFNKCITRCRLRSTLALCKCLRFMSPYEYLDAGTNTVYCTLQHNECLDRYNYKWRSVMVDFGHEHSVTNVMDDGLYCPECLPSCSETRYAMSVLALPLGANNMPNFPQHSHGNYTELTLLQVFFERPHAQYFRQIEKHAWLETFSTIGGICSIIAGFSLVGICEVVYFFTHQVYTTYHREALLERNRTITRRQELIILP